MKHDSVCLIIPIYNRANLVGETIESALAQTIPFDEIILVDDGSTDGVENVISRFGENVKLIKQNNQGVQAARNLGVLVSSSEWITFCDSDDLLMPDFLRKMKSLIHSSRHFDAVYCNFELFGVDVVKSTHKIAQCPFDYLAGASIEEGFALEIPDLLSRNLRFQPFFPSGCLLKRPFYKKLDGFNVYFNGVGAEDWDFTLRAIVSGEIAFCLEPLVSIRRHNGNDSADSLRMTLGELIILKKSTFIKNITLPGDLAEVQTQISSRSKAAFNLAFDAGRYELLKELYPVIKDSDKDFRFWVKWMIALMPPFIRDKTVHFVKKR